METAMETNMDSSSDGDLAKPESVTASSHSRLVYLPSIADFDAPTLIEAARSVDLSCYLADDAALTVGTEDASNEPSDLKFGGHHMTDLVYTYDPAIRPIPAPATSPIQVFDTHGELIALVEGLRWDGRDTYYSAGWTEIPKTWQSMGGDQA